MAHHELIGSQGCGSAIIELALTRASTRYRLTEIPDLQDGPERERLLELNPLGQVPTMVLPDGTVLTESAAMILHLDETVPEAGLLPRSGTRDRPHALNLLVLMVAAIYPTFTFADDPERWAGEGAAAALLKQRVDGRRLDILRRLDKDLTPNPFVFGAEPGAIDFYIAVLTRWRPGRPFFDGAMPKLVDIARAVEARSELGAILARHFPD